MNTVKTILFLSPWLLLLSAGCALIEQRPEQQYSDARAALRAAQEVKADIRAPELFRQATELYLDAQADYRYHRFQDSRRKLERARLLAEQSELEALLAGAARESLTPPPPPPPAPKPRTNTADAGYAEPEPIWSELQKEESGTPKKK